MSKNPLLFEVINKCNTKGELGKEYAESVSFKTGIDIFDMLNASFNSTTGEIKEGIPAGTITSIIGKSGGGKTTLGIQMAWGIIKDIEQSTMFIYDYESTTTKERVKNILGIDDETLDSKIKIFDTDIYIENLLTLIKKIEEAKVSNPDIFLLKEETKKRGRKIYAPTVVLCDSIAMMQPKEVLDAEEVKGNMTASQTAKVLAQVFKRIVQPCKNANIMPIFINHITSDISIGLTPVSPSLNYLKQGETLPGGNTPRYLSNLMIKVTPATKLSEDKTYKVGGFETKVELIKSKSAPAGTTFKLILDQVNGFDNVLSNLDFLKSNKKILGGGSSFYLENKPDVKFSLGGLSSKLEENEELRKAFEELTYETLKESIRVPSKRKQLISEELVHLDGIVDETENKEIGDIVNE